MTFRRMGAALVLLVALTGPLAAQVIDFGTVTTQDAGSCATAKACVTFALPTGTVAVTAQVSGTFSGTLTFEGTSDGTNWSTITLTKLSDKSAVTTATAAGQFYIPNTGFLSIRLRAGTFVSGTATVYLTRGYMV